MGFEPCFERVWVERRDGEEPVRAHAELDANIKRAERLLIASNGCATLLVVSIHECEMRTVGAERYLFPL